RDDAAPVADHRALPVRASPARCAGRAGSKGPGLPCLVETLELETRAELQRRRVGAGPQRGQPHEVRRSPVANRVVEVLAIGRVEDVREEIDRPTRIATTIAKTQVELEE